MDALISRQRRRVRRHGQVEEPVAGRTKQRCDKMADQNNETCPERGAYVDRVGHGAGISVSRGIDVAEAKWRKAPW